MKNLEGFTMKGKRSWCVGSINLSMVSNNHLGRGTRSLTHISRNWDSREVRFTTIYTKQVRYHFIYVALYVKNMLLVGYNMHLVKEVKQQLSSKFDMKDIEEAHFIF